MFQNTFLLKIKNLINFQQKNPVKWSFEWRMNKILKLKQKSIEKKDNKKLELNLKITIR
jgi:hypothetical protein